jgi:hypothetical protein
VDIYARLFNANGEPSGQEFLVNTGTNVCANPSVAPTDGGFVVSWGERDSLVRQQGWDIYARALSSTGQGPPAVRVNTWTYGDQLDPQVSASGSELLVIWTSMGQDGSMEGVYGQFLQPDGSLAGTEFRVSTTTMSKQMQPDLASDGVGGFLAAWTSYVGGAVSFDLRAQRYSGVAEALEPMDPPFVYVPFEVVDGSYQPQIRVSWPVQAGLAVDHYEVFVDGAATATGSVTSNVWVMTSTQGLTLNATHSFQVAYVTTGGQRSPKSAAASAKTWSGYNWGGIPFEWMTANFGSDMSSWPGANAVLSAGAPSLTQLFLTGADPYNPQTWLTAKLVGTPQGLFLQWNPQPGLTYHVQTSSDLSSWEDVGSPRFAAGAQDSVFVGSGNVGYFRVLRLR